MKSCLHIIFCSALLFSSCDQENVKSFQPEKDAKAIQEIMNAQQAAWNFGDLNTFMKYYWKSDSLKFVGKRGLTYGWQSTLDNYVKSYPDKAAMGRLLFTNMAVEPLNETNAYVIGKWELFRIADTLSGHYSLLWKKMEGKWVIVADHSS